MTDSDSEPDTQGPPTPTSSTAQVDSGDEIPKCDVHFAFGPQNWYYIRCGDTWRFVRSNQSVWESLDVKDTYWVAFKHTTGFFIGGKNENGIGKVVHTWNDGHLVPASEVDSFIESRQAYSKLDAWLSDITEKDVSKVEKATVTIGPKGSYFARCGSSWTSHNLPPDLTKAIEEDESIPAVVALGMNDSWIMLWSDGSRSWDLKFKYPSLQKTGVLDTKIDTMKPAFAALNPYQEDKYLIVSRDGQFHYSTALGSKEESEKLNQITDNYMLAQAKLHGRTFTQTLTRDGWTRESVISPDGVHRKSEIVLAQFWRARRDIVMRKEALSTIGAVGVGVGVLSKMSGGSTVKAVGAAGFAGIIAGIFYTQGALQGYREAARL